MINLRTVILGIITIAFMGGLIYLQIYLSKLQNKGFGFILPIISVSTSLFIILSMAASAQYMPLDILNIFSAPMLMFIFFLFNIPTIIFLVIYFICRESIKKSKEKNGEIYKMNIQDL